MRKLTVTNIKSFQAYQMVFASPETSFKGTESRKLICMETSWEKLVAYVIDKAQCRSKRVCSYNVF